MYRKSNSGVLMVRGGCAHIVGSIAGYQEDARGAARVCCLRCNFDCRGSKRVNDRSSLGETVALRQAAVVADGRKQALVWQTASVLGSVHRAAQTSVASRVVSGSIME